MNKIIRIIFILFLSVLLMGSVIIKEPPQFYQIPKQTLDLFKVMEEYSQSGEFEIEEFQISRQVTMKEYKEYLNEVKKDSSENYYLSQLPDKSIGTEEIWREYITNPIYEDYPVLGISWDNAINYCNWKTLRDNVNTKEIKYYYRLPQSSEWLAAYYYLNEKNIENDFNKNYADWLFGSKESSIWYSMDIEKKEWPYDYFYVHDKNGRKVLKRKQVIGNSYLYQLDKVYYYYDFSFYADEGYRHIGFRYIKDFK